MIVHSSAIRLSTRGFTDCRDITGHLDEQLRKSGVLNGLLTVMVPGSTGAVTTIEYESGALSDLKDALDLIAPMDKEYAHNLKWGDGNGFSHVRAALMKPSMSIMRATQSGRMTSYQHGGITLRRWNKTWVLFFMSRWA